MLGAWRRLSISARLYLVIGTMAVLIATELLTVRFAMGTLSAVRAFVGGEGLWSKAQKNAIFRLQRFGATQRQEDYQAFLDYLKIPEGDHQARVELIKAKPDHSLVRSGFLRGEIHPDDIEPMIQLLSRFGWEPHLARAIAIWTEADGLLDEFRLAGVYYHSLLKTPTPQREIDEVHAKVLLLNDRLTLLEEEFSRVLGEGSRWLESVIITMLFFAVLMVETIGLTLTYRTGRSISRGLDAINDAALAIGRGDFSHELKIETEDEIGRLADSINVMRGLLDRSYKTLEVRVAERTADLMRISSENERLYHEAAEAVKSRDEFLSIASHELKTPITSLHLQLQLLDKMTKERVKENGTESPWLARFLRSIEAANKSSSWLIVMLDELLDMTRIRAGRLKLDVEEFDMRTAVQKAVDQLAEDARRSGSVVVVRQSPEALIGQWDRNRVEQIAINLLSNAIKYGRGRRIDVSLAQEGQRVRLVVNDEGMGISREMQGKIFERFERAIDSRQISGLGLGLYIVRQLVEAHGGRVSVQSEVAQGSTFTVELPMRSEGDA